MQKYREQITGHGVLTLIQNIQQQTITNTI